MTRRIPATVMIVLVLFGQGCSRSKRTIDMQRDPGGANRAMSSRLHSVPVGASVVPMERRNGVLYIPVEINGMKMDFILDTGASDVCISLAEAIVLFKQGTLRKEHVIGSNEYMDATGKVNVGTTVILQEVKVGGRTLRDVQASIVENMGAPLLLGQSVLQRFGQVKIDYDQNLLIIQ